MTLYTSNIISAETDQKITAELTRVLSIILTDNEEIINNIDEIKKVAGWYIEARKSPNKIPSLIINESIERLLESTKPFLVNILIDSIKVKTEVVSDSVSFPEIVIISRPIKPYVEYVKKVNQTELDKLRVTFSIVLSGKLQDVQIHPNFRSRRIDVNIDSTIVWITVSIIKVSVSTSHIPTVSFNKKVVLVNKEFLKLEDLSFHPQM